MRGRGVRACRARLSASAPLARGTSREEEVARRSGRRQGRVFPPGPSVGLICTSSGPVGKGASCRPRRGRLPRPERPVLWAENQGGKIVLSRCLKCFCLPKSRTRMAVRAAGDGEPQELPLAAGGCHVGDGGCFLTKLSLSAPWEPATTLLDIHPKELKTMSPQKPSRGGP